jgi:hypothetical protein
VYDADDVKRVTTHHPCCTEIETNNAYLFLDVDQYLLEYSIVQAKESLADTSDTIRHLTVHIEYLFI